MGKIIRHSTLENIPFMIMMGVSILMGIIAFCTPPKYDIPKSVLSFISLMLVFSALWIAFVALKKGIDAKFSYGQTSLELNNPDQDTSKKNTNHEDE